MLASVTLYRPLVFWGNNPWDLSAPQAIFIVAFVEFTILFASLALISRWVTDIYLSAIFIAIAALILLNVHLVDSLPGVIILAAAAVVVLAIATHHERRGSRWATFLAVSVLVVAPSVQVVIRHLENRIPYPAAATQVVGTVAPQPDVEDILVLIVDGYPMATVAEQWFEHDTEALRRALSSMGFATPPVSWSHNTTTSLAIPSMLEMRQVADVSHDGAWQNQKSIFDIARGGSLVVAALEGAGFNYTHIESGWNGDVCGLADACRRRPWIDGANWGLLRSSVMAPLIESVYGSPHATATRQTADHLLSLGLFGDGERDFVYAHMMLPHAPRVVDADCKVKPAHNRPQGTGGVQDQLACVDSLLLDIMNSITDETVVVIAGDHGTATRSQISTPISEWTDDDIVERLGAFLAYRMPSRCRTPAAQSNVQVMRVMMACATDLEIPEPAPSYVLGLEDHVIVDSSRLARIENRLSSTLATAAQ